MFATVAPLTLVLLAAELPDANTGASAAIAAPATSEAAASPVAGLRQRPSTVALKRGIHELKDPGGWPAEPPTVAGPIDAARFDAAVVRMCGEVARDEGLPEVARVVREVAAQTNSDPFMLAALAYRGSRCRPWLTDASGVGLLQIKASMFAAGARLPFPRADLERERLLVPRTTCASARRCSRCGKRSTWRSIARSAARPTAPRSRTSSGETRCGARRPRIAR